jgi:hypothetical protein
VNVVVRGGGVTVSGRPIELNGIEVEGHACDPDQKVVRLRQTTSIPVQERGDIR